MPLKIANSTLIGPIFGLCMVFVLNNINNYGTILVAVLKLQYGQVVSVRCNDMCSLTRFWTYPFVFRLSKNQPDMFVYICKHLFTILYLYLFFSAIFLKTLINEKCVLMAAVGLEIAECRYFRSRIVFDCVLRTRSPF